MTIIEHIERLKNHNKQEAVNSLRLILATNFLLGTTKNRIIRDGKATDGGNIGNYSRKPNYFPKASFVKKSAFKPQGKRGKSKGVTMYLPEGYYQFRGLQGRENSFVNLELSGDMLKDYQLALTGNDILFGFTKMKESKKRKANEKRFGKRIFGSSPPEREQYRQELINGIKKISIDDLK